MKIPLVVYIPLFILALIAAVQSGGGGGIANPVIFPTLSTSQRASIPTPGKGMAIIHVDHLEFFDGSAWHRMDENQCGG